MTEIDYLPYKAINVYIDRDYLDKVLRDVLKGKVHLSKEDQITFSKIFNQHVSILGFRNKNRAPLQLQVNAFASAFEEKNELIPITLSTWTKIKHEFAEKVKAWLDSEKWDDLALQREYLDTEGFINQWQDGLTFDDIENAFKKANPSLEFSRDDLILMVLWISGKLPKQNTDS